MHMDMQASNVVANVEGVLARVDGMHITGFLSGFNFLRVAGSNVRFGNPPPGFFEQTELPLKFGGEPARIDSSTVQFSYLENLVVYADAEDVSFYKNGLPDFRLGGQGRRCDASWNLVPETGAAA